MGKFTRKITQENILKNWFWNVFQFGNKFLSQIRVDEVLQRYLSFCTKFKKK